MTPIYLVHSWVAYEGTHLERVLTDESVALDLRFSEAASKKYHQQNDKGIIVARYVHDGTEYRKDEKWPKRRRKP